MLGYKFVKKTEIENYKNEIERLRKEVKELNEVVNAEKENNKKLYIEYCGLGEKIENLEKKISELENEKVEKKPARKPRKKPETNEVKKEPKKKRIYRKRKQNKESEE